MTRTPQGAIEHVKHVQVPEAADCDFALAEARERAAMSTRPLLSMAEGMLILLVSLCRWLPAGLLLSVLLLRAPRIPLPWPYPIVLGTFSMGFSGAAV